MGKYAHMLHHLKTVSIYVPLNILVTVLRVTLLNLQTIF